MKKTVSAFIISVSLSLNLSAQEAPVRDLQQIHAAAKNAYAKVDELDKLKQELNYYDEHPVTGKDQQQELLETYRAIVNGYSANNHFKQGYGVYQKYLSLKENFLSAEKADAIAKANQSIEEKQSKDANELMTMQSEAQQLQLDNDYLLSKRKSFKHYFSLVIIALTVAFAFLLLQTGLKLNKIRHDLKAGRERLKIVHGMAVLGKLKKGVLFTIQHIFSSLKNLSAENSRQIDQLGQPPGQKNNDLVNLRKQMNDLNRLADQ